MRILYFGTYDPLYPRNRTLIKGLRMAGATVTECSDRSSLGLKYLKLIFKFWRLRKSFDVMIVGFPGQETMILARILTSKPIVFDAFTSHYGGHILDRKTYGQKSWRARYYKLIDRVSCRLANRVLLDTNAHINFFVHEFGLSPTIFRRIFVGTDSELFKPEPEPDGKYFKVHFHGTFVPLQGVSIIVRSAKLLEHENILFTIIGKGQDYKEVRNLTKELNVENINFVDRVPYESLANAIRAANVCLGIFGDTVKAGLVIPNKIFEAVACQRAVITMDSPAIREVFRDGDNIFLCRAADPSELANKILKVKNNQELRAKIAKGGYTTFVDKCSETVLGRDLIKVIGELIG